VLPMAEAWDAGDRRRALELVPEDLVREIFMIGPDELARERVEALQDAGIPTVVLAFYGPREGLRAAIDALGPR
jgi:alkanesulfonate monooxygenase SsuD/methylene tetrahydromethanopterin reductase-like flavin-dependent oxidoreductase (luciferase family)